ncbi:glycosyltransferase family 2 protein [Vibrio lentus]
MNDKFIASVVIPTFGRNEFLDRAISSVISSNGSEFVEIIVVDDASPEPYCSDLLREHDVFITLDRNSGAAIARNKGISLALGRIIYLLDSDDFIVNRDFISDFELYSDDVSLRYSSVSSQGYFSTFPDILDKNDFFDFIFFRYPHICQTSSLFFNRDLDLRFDERLPKHQDWDFVIFSAIMNGVQVKKGNGEIFFDRSDRMSISRKKNVDKSKVWFDKILESDCFDVVTIDYIRFFLFSESSKTYSIFRFLYIILKYIFSGKMRLKKALIKIYDRFLK